MLAVDVAKARKRLGGDNEWKYMANSSLISRLLA
jgi:hypothetical protein